MLILGGAGTEVRRGGGVGIAVRVRCGVERDIRRQREVGGKGASRGREDSTRRTIGDIAEHGG